MSDEPSDFESRLTDLEVHAAHQSDQIDMLNETITQMHDKLDRLMRRLKMQEEQISSLEDAVAPIEQTKPPHY